MKLKNLIYAFLYLIIAASCNESVIGPEQVAQLGTSDLKAGAIGTTYYVAKTGSDGNTGTSTSPFLTIQKAANVVNPGDIVIVRDGTYSNTVANYGTEHAIVIINRSGTSSNWITFKAENKGGVVLDGLNFATEHGIMMNANYVSVEGFEIKNIFLWAVSSWPGSDNTVFKNNYIHDIGNVCSASSNGFCAFYIKGSNNMVIEDNKIKNIGRLAPDEGCTGSGTYFQWHDHGIYVDGCTNVSIRNNIFLDCDNGWSIHLYSSANDYSSNISILNNTFYAHAQRSAGHIILSCPITTVNITNNLFIMSANTDDIGFNAADNVAVNVSGDYAPYITGATIKNNMMYRGNGIIASTSSQIAKSNNIVNTDPLIVDLANNDFRLQSKSPAINAGIDVGLTTDYSGNAIVGRPDMGANEYGSSVSAPVVTAPVVTAPVVTAPVVTAPVVTAPVVTAPVVTTPVVTAPVVTTPVVVTAKTYYNTRQSGTATKNSCGTGYKGSSVTYTVVANTYKSTVSQADANNLAIADVKLNKQAFANANGTCTRISYWWRR